MRNIMKLLRHAVPAGGESEVLPGVGVHRGSGDAS